MKIPCFPMPVTDRKPDPHRGETSPGISALLALVSLVAVCLLVHECHHPPVPLGLDAPPEMFSAERAFQRLERLLGDETPHPLGSRANAEVRDRLLAELEGLSLQPVVNSHWVPNANSWSSSLALTHNVVAELPSSHPDLPAIVLACHYDSVSAGPGAADDGAAVAAILEVVRALQAEAPLARPLILLFTDGEEAGLFGARAFVTHNSIAARVGLILNFEARGSSGGSLLFETSENNLWLIQQAARGLSRPMSSSAYVEVYRIMPNSSDLTIFMQHDLPGMNFAFIGSPQHYHTPLDNLAHLDKASLQHHGENALGMVQQLLIADWESGERAGGDVVYTDLFARWIIAWPAAWAPWMVLGLLAIMTVCFRLLWQRLQWRTTEIARAAFCWLLVMIGGTSFGWLARGLLKLSGATPTWFPAEMYYDVAVTCLCGSVAVFLILAILRPAPAPFFLVHGIALGLGAVISALTLTGFSYVFFLPAVVSAVAAVAFLKFSPHASGRAIAAIALGLVTAIIVYPFMARLPVALGVGAAAPGLGAIVALLLLPIVPLLSSLSRRLLACSAAVLALATGGFLVGALQSPAFTPNSPQQISLSYLEQQDSNTAQVSISSQEAPIPLALVESLTPLDAPDALFPLPGIAFSTSPAGRPAPQMEIFGGTTAAAQSSVTLRLLPTLPSQRLLLGVPASVTLDQVSAAGHDLVVPPEEMAGRNWFQFRGVPESGIEVSLFWKDAPQISVVTVGISSDLPPHLRDLVTLRDHLPACPAAVGDLWVAVAEVTLEVTPAGARLER